MLGICFRMPESIPERDQPERNFHSIRLIIMYSWNEYHEWTGIEPHSDGTAKTLALGCPGNLTAHYISELD